MASLSGDGLMLWERLRNLQFGAEQAQKAGQPEVSQVRLTGEHCHGCTVGVHTTSMPCRIGTNGGNIVAVLCFELRGRAPDWQVQAQLAASRYSTG